jgi:hypothetical protein
MPLEKFFQQRIFIFETNKKSSNLGTPLSADPAEETVLVFAFCSGSASGLFLRFIPLALMCDCYMGITKSPPSRRKPLLSGLISNNDPIF